MHHPLKLSPQKRQNQLLPDHPLHSTPLTLHRSQSQKYQRNLNHQVLPRNQPLEQLPLRVLNRPKSNPKRKWYRIQSEHHPVLRAVQLQMHQVGAPRFTKIYQRRCWNAYLSLFAGVHRGAGSSSKPTRPRRRNHLKPQNGCTVNPTQCCQRSSLFYHNIL